VKNLNLKLTSNELHKNSQSKHQTVSTSFSRRLSNVRCCVEVYKSRRRLARLDIVVTVAIFRPLVATLDYSSWIIQHRLASFVRRISLDDIATSLLQLLRNFRWRADLEIMYLK
jgi:hypothetical protein